MLIKFTFIVYFASFFIVWVIKYIVANKNKTKLVSEKQFRNILIISIIALALMSTWYLLNFNTMFDRIINTNEYQNNVFSNNNFFKNLNTNLKNMFYYKFYLVLLKSYGYLILFSLIYVLFKKDKNNFAIKDMILIGIMSIIPFLGIQSQIRYLLPLIPIVSLLIGVFLFDYLSLIRKIKLPVFLGFVLIIIVLMSSYNNYLTKYTSRKSLSEIYLKGISSPQKYPVSQDNIIELITNLTTDNKTIVFLFESEIGYSLIQKMRYMNYTAWNSIFCIALSRTKEDVTFCNQEYTAESVCSFPIVIDSNYRIREKNLKLLTEFYKPKLELINEILANWESCKTNYTLVETITNIPIEGENKFYSIYIYKKN